MMMYLSTSARGGAARRLVLSANLDIKTQQQLPFFSSHASLSLHLNLLVVCGGFVCPAFTRPRDHTER